MACSGLPKAGSGLLEAGSGFQEAGSGLQGGAKECTYFVPLEVKAKPVAERQEMVSGTLALLNGLSEAAFYVGRALAPKEDKVLLNTGKSVHLYFLS